MEIDYAYLENFLRFKLKGYRDNLEYEDAVQEGLIRAWKDAEEGSRTMEHIRNRAYSWAWNFLSSEHNRYPTGGIAKSREGITKVSGDVAREKVSSYREEFLKLHNRYPTSVEVGDALGMTKSKVQATVASLKKNYIKPVYKTVGGQTRLDYSYYRSSPLYRTDPESGEETLDFQAEAKFAESWEEQFVSDEMFKSTISVLSPHAQKLLVMTYVYGMTQREIGDLLGIRQATVGRQITKALEVLRGDTPTKDKEESTTCKNGHLKTKDSFYTWTNGGRQKRSCKECVKSRNRQRTRDASSKR